MHNKIGPAAAPPSTAFSRLERVLEYAPLFLLGVAPVVFLKSAGEFENNPKMAFLQWGIGLLALLALARRAGLRSWPKKTLLLHGTIVAFFLACLASLTYAINPDQGIFFLLQWGAGIILYFFLTSTIKKESTVDRIFCVTAISSFAVALIGILQHLDISLSPLGDIPQLVKPASTFSNKNMAAEYLAIVFPLLAGAAVLARTPLLRAACACISLPTVLIYLVVSDTRSSWVAVITCLILAGCFGPLRTRLRQALVGRRALAALAAPVLAVLVFCMLSGTANLNKYGQRFLSIVKMEQGSTNQLRYIWLCNTLAMVKDNPWLGVGLGNFKIHYPLYHRKVLVDWVFSEANQLTRTHNDHLQILAELGLAGALPYAAMFIVAGLLGLGILKNRAAPDDRRLRALFALLAMLSYFIVGLFSFPMERALPPIYLLTSFAVIAFLSTGALQPSAPVPARPLHRVWQLAAATALLACIMTSYFYIRKVSLADKYFVEGMALEEAGKLKEANARLQKAFEVFPMWNFNVPSLLARNYTMLGDYERAIQTYEAAFRVHPNNTNAILNTGYCYLKMNEYAKAQEYFEKFVSIMPDSAKGHNNLGIVHYVKKRPALAIEQYQKACEIDPSYAEPHFNLANLYRAQGRLQDALRAYEQALKLNPNLDDARKMFADLCMASGDFGRAREVFDPLLQDKKRAAENHALLGTMYQRYNKYAEALEQYNNALRFDSQNGYLHYNAGLCLYNAHAYDEAERAFARAIELNPAIPEAYSLLGQLYLRKQDDGQALKFFEKALQMNPSLKEAQYNVATIHLRLGHYDRARQGYQKTLGLDPHNSLAHYNLGTLLRHHGEYAAALVHFEKALENPSDLIDLAMARRFIAEMKAKTAKTKN